MDEWSVGSMALCFPRVWMESMACVRASYRNFIEDTPDFSERTSIWTYGAAALRLADCGISAR